jgi:hypothetical protein
MGNLVAPFLHQAFASDYANMMDRLRQALLEDEAARAQAEPA